MHERWVLLFTLPNGNQMETIVMAGSNAWDTMLRGGGIWLDSSFKIGYGPDVVRWVPPSQIVGMTLAKSSA